MLAPFIQNSEKFQSNGTINFNYLRITDEINCIQDFFTTLMSVKYWEAKAPKSLFDYLKINLIECYQCLSSIEEDFKLKFFLLDLIKNKNNIYSYDILEYFEYYLEQIDISEICHYSLIYFNSELIDFLLKKGKIYESHFNTLSNYQFICNNGSIKFLDYWHSKFQIHIEFMISVLSCLPVEIPNHIINNYLDVFSLTKSELKKYGNEICLKSSLLGNFNIYKYTSKFVQNKEQIIKNACIRGNFNIIFKLILEGTMSDRMLEWVCESNNFDLFLYVLRLPLNHNINFAARTCIIHNNLEMLKILIKEHNLNFSDYSDLIKYHPKIHSWITENYAFLNVSLEDIVKKHTIDSFEYHLNFLILSVDQIRDMFIMCLKNNNLNKAKLLALKYSIIYPPFEEIAQYGNLEILKLVGHPNQEIINSMIFLSIRSYSDIDLLKYLFNIGINVNYNDVTELACQYYNYEVLLEVLTFKNINNYQENFNKLILNFNEKIIILFLTKFKDLSYDFEELLSLAIKTNSLNLITYLESSSKT